MGLRLIPSLAFVSMVAGSHNSTGNCSTHQHGTLGGREYLTYVPGGVCKGELALPLLLLFHGYGTQARSEIVKFERAAEAHGFVLLAAEGTRVGPRHPRSFNAPSCCGEAHARNVDDVAFADALAAHAVETLPVRKGAIFASGYSNGGFLVSHLAAAGRTRLRGIAPLAGHEYVVRAKRPTPVFMNHCAHDTIVNPMGCCAGAEGGAGGANGTRRGGACCCDIGANRTRCVSTMEIFRDWLKLNGCARQPVPFAIGSTYQSPSCLAGVGCAANTSLCMFRGHCYHGGWAHAFSAADDVVAFFAREACALSGAWIGTRCIRGGDAHASHT